MCVVGLALNAHPHWRLIVAGNRDEYHARPSQPLHKWQDRPGVIAGRDLISGGTWMGVSEDGRFAVVTNIRDANGPDPNKTSRGVLVTDWLANALLPATVVGFNPFNLIAASGVGADYLSNRPIAMRRPLGAGIHGLSNAIFHELWPRKDRLVGQLSGWLAGKLPDVGELFKMLRDESIFVEGAHSVFIRNAVYGTRCSTVVMVDHDGRGQITERRFDAAGCDAGQTVLDFRWPAISAAS